MFDPVCKFLAETFATDFAKWLLGKPISLTRLSPSELSLEPIRADALILLQSEKLILHLEFQTEPEQEIPFRMIDYRLRSYRRYPQKLMRQVVIYLKPTRSKLVQQQVFSIPGTRHEFEVIRLWEQPTAAFLESSGLLPLAVLSRTENQAETLAEVAQRIEQITNRRQQSNLAASTAILAGLVLEEQVIKQLLRQEIMRESVIYQKIKAEGKAEGIQEGEISLILRLLKRRIGTVNSELETRIRRLSVGQLEELGESLLDFSGERDLLAWLASH